jgi:hypothetical protein
VIASSITYCFPYNKDENEFPKVEDRNSLMKVNMSDNTRGSEIRDSGKYQFGSFKDDGNVK